MQRLYHIPPDADHAVERDPGDLDRARADGGWIWLDVVGVDAAEVQAIADEFGFDHLATEDVLEESRYPGVEDYGDHTMAVILGIAEDEERLRLVECDVFVGSGYLVTFLHEDLPGFRWMREHLLRPGRPAGLGPSRFLALVMESEASRFRQVGDHLEERIELLEDQALQGEPAVIADVHALRRDMLTLRRVVGPQEDVFGTLADENLPGVNDRARMRFAGIERHYQRTLDGLEAARGMLEAALETYRATVAEKANEVMKVLTVFAAIVLPLSLMAGIYGMNFAHMPELGWRWAYFGLLGLMASVGLGLWVYFARRGFIGGPRVGAVPRTIGRGLAGVVKVTTSPVTGLVRAITGRTPGGREEGGTGA